MHVSSWSWTNSKNGLTENCAILGNYNSAVVAPITMVTCAHVMSTVRYGLKSHYVVNNHCSALDPRDVLDAIEHNRPNSIEANDLLSAYYTIKRPRMCYQGATKFTPTDYMVRKLILDIIDEHDKSSSSDQPLLARHELSKLDKRKAILVQTEPSRRSQPTTLFMMHCESSRNAKCYFNFAFTYGTLLPMSTLTYSLNISS